ncbi:MAG TPA: NAD(P)-binding domain-containing protein [Bacteroidales bacterium]|nr:NAD(P)-binding domain-containing protein [Bacteroidales bacterium]
MDELLIEKIVIYSVVLLFCLIVVYIYLRKQRRESSIVEQKITQAKADGLYEPVSLHPVVDVNSCIKTGACIMACPEEDILGIRNGKATTINASHCIGHGACFHACPTEAITLCIGTEKRGVDLPHVSQTFETNVKGLYIAGELGGMGLIKNAVEQGRQAVENIAATLRFNPQQSIDLIIVGAGPAGISAALTAKKHKIRALVIEQDSLGGTVYSFPRSKIIMTSPMDLPLFGKVKLTETSKSELLGLWNKVLDKNEISIRVNCKADAITKEGDIFHVLTQSGEVLCASAVLLAIGRRGTPRKLGIPGEQSEKVAYRLLEPEDISQKHIVVVGGGDSAVESALLLVKNNHVTLSYRGNTFSRLKPKNRERIHEAIASGLLDMRFNSRLLSIEKDRVSIAEGEAEKVNELQNDLVYIFAGGELPTQFLEKAGVSITRKFGEAILKH